MTGKRAVVLCGGKGTRLRPYTVVFPKPLMPIGETPILEIVIKQLASAGFDHITLAVNHQAELIKAYFSDGSKWNIKIDYSLEEKPLSTMAPLKLVKDLPENFLVTNGDILTNLDFANFFEEHASENRNFTISAFNRQQVVDYGVLDINSDQNLTAFREKPTDNYLVSMGIYAVNRKVLDLIPEDTAYGFDDLMNKMLNENISVDVAPFGGYWLDIGRPDDYARAIDEFSSIQDKLPHD